MCLLHSDLQPAHEMLVGMELEANGHDVSCSCDVSPEYREYERTVTTVVNAYLRPVCRAYLRRLSEAAESVQVMTSAGGLVPARRCGRTSGRAAALGARRGRAGRSRGGGGQRLPRRGHLRHGRHLHRRVPRARRHAGARGASGRSPGLPVRMPSLDVHTIGAGGGSIARLDDGGALLVGPRSAGAVPGPACYGRGGTEPTVTDADLVAGRIPVGAAFPGLGRARRGRGPGGARRGRRHRRGRDRGGGRGHGGGHPGRDRRAGRRPAGSGPGGVRRRRPAARLRARRGARDRGGDRSGAGRRAVRRRASSARRARSTSSARCPTRSTTPPPGCCPTSSGTKPASDCSRSSRRPSLPSPGA